MKYQITSYKNADIILRSDKYSGLYNELTSVIDGITDKDLKTEHQRVLDDKKSKNKAQNASLSVAINNLIKERLESTGWQSESSIFQGEEYGSKTADKVWRLDFAKETISVEVGFNHGEAIAWNLLKPVLASEVNNVEKAIETEVGIFITATKSLKSSGCFDNAVGEYEKVLRYLVPLSTLLHVPILVIGLEAQEGFELVPKYPGKPKNWGQIIN